MRKLTLLFAFIFAIGKLIDCSYDDSRDEPVVAKYNVSGTWDMLWYTKGGNWNEMAVLSYFITLNADKTFKANYRGTVATGTYTYDNKDLIVTTSQYGTEHIKIMSMEGSDAM